MEAVRICKEVCGPLAAAHARGMIHRDIKPPNIFIAGGRERRSIKLLDFGIVKQRDEQITMHGSLVGTLEYMSPEQAIGSAVDPRCDVWGLGATLFFCLAGRPPFQAPVPLDVLKMIAEQDAPKLREVAPSVPPELAQVVDRCLLRDREKRWASVLELEAALSRCLESAPPKPQSARAVAAIALAMAAAGVVATLALSTRAQPPKPRAPIEIPPVRRAEEAREVAVERPGEAIDEVSDEAIDEAIDDLPDPELVAPRPQPAKKVARRPQRPPPRRPEEPMRGYR
jgi:serine/threonine-protein kinase